jgi:hemolysin activation/secretion protein
MQRVKIVDVDLIVENKDTTVVNNTFIRNYINDILSAPSLTQNEIESYVELMNKIPGYEASYMLRKVTRSSNDMNSAELVLDVKRTKARFFIDANNHGHRNLGKYHFGASAQLLNPMGWNDSLVVHALTSNKPNKLKILTAGYMKRLTSFGTTLSLLASNMNDKPYTSATLNNSDKHRVYKAELEQYLCLDSRKSVKAEVGVERYEIKENDTTPQRYSHNDAYIGLKMKYVDTMFLHAMNQLHLVYSSTINPAKFKQVNTTATKFDSNFSVLKIDAFRDQALPHNFSLYGHVRYQHSPNKLPLENQFIAGGHTIGRAYTTGLISSDKGLSATLEARYTHTCKPNKMIEHVQPYIFGEMVKVSQPASSISKSRLNSWGGGLRFFTPFGLRVDLEGAVPSSKIVSVDNVPIKNKTKFSFFLSQEFKI